MKLEEYKSFRDKSSRFKNQIRINTSSDFDKWYEKQVFNESSFIYRGVPEAKYKMYSSAQRYWLTQELYKSGKKFNMFVESLIQELKSANKGLLPRYFKSFNFPANDFLYLSFLQHYQGPSTLLDFSYNLSKALFFCFDTMTYTPSSTKIDNYCSVYIIDTTYRGVRNELISLPQFLDNSELQVEEILSEFRQKSPNVSFDLTDLEKEMRELPYAKYSQTKLLFIPGSNDSQNDDKMGSIPSLIYGSNISILR